MTLLEHLQELRRRLARACLAVVLGSIGGYLLSLQVLEIIQNPYCNLMADLATKHNDGVLPAGYTCPFVQLSATAPFVLRMQISLWVGVILAAPLWLYQLWAFIAPGLHRHERRWAYWFTGIAAPLFASGALVAYFVIAKGLPFLLQFNPPDVSTQLELTAYVDFVTRLMLLF